MRKLVDTALTLAKVALKSRPVAAPVKATGGGRRLVVMGNGPSLADTLRERRDLLASGDTMAVNFAANTPEFFDLKPRHYILADPHFFTSGDSNVDRLWENLGKADWELTLHIPVGKSLPPFLAGKEGLELRRFNMTPGEGWDAVVHRLYSRGLAMPRPRNVMIPALMEGIREGYGEIYIVGADHTWPHSLYVDDRNRVVTVQPHFYKEDPAELDRIASVYADVRLHDVLGSMVVAFRSYHLIRRYADSLGVKVVNATPCSLIDAFERLK